MEEHQNALGGPKRPGIRRRILQHGGIYFAYSVTIAVVSAHLKTRAPSPTDRPFLDGRGSPIYPSIEGHDEDKQKYDENDGPHSGWNFLY